MILITLLSILLVSLETCIAQNFSPLSTGLSQSYHVQLTPKSITKYTVRFRIDVPETTDENDFYVYLEKTEVFLVVNQIETPLALNLLAYNRFKSQLELNYRNIHPHSNDALFLNTGLIRRMTKNFKSPEYGRLCGHESDGKIFRTIDKFLGKFKKSDSRVTRDLNTGDLILEYDIDLGEKNLKNLFKFHPAAFDLRIAFVYICGVGKGTIIGQSLERFIPEEKYIPLKYNLNARDSSNGNSIGFTVKDGHLNILARLQYDEPNMVKYLNNSKYGIASTRNSTYYIYEYFRKNQVTLELRVGHLYDAYNKPSFFVSFYARPFAAIKFDLTIFNVYIYHDKPLFEDYLSYGHGITVSEVGKNTISLDFPTAPKVITIDLDNEDDIKGVVVDDVCAFCLDCLRNNEGVARLSNCPHCFHKDCVDPWIQKGKLCPICRN